MSPKLIQHRIDALVSILQSPGGIVWDKAKLAAHIGVPQNRIIPIVSAARKQGHNIVLVGDGYEILPKRYKPKVREIAAYYEVKAAHIAASTDNQ